MTDKPNTLTELSDIYQLERPLRKSSSKQHVYAITSFAKFLGRVPLVSDLNAPTVNKWLAWIIEDQRLAASTANLKRRVVLALWPSCGKCASRVTDPVASIAASICWLTRGCSPQWHSTTSSRNA